MRNLALALAASCFVAACQKAASTEAGQTIDKPRWNTICLGRYLLDIPDNVEVASVEAGYHVGYGFPGVHSPTASYGIRGQSWDGIALGESVASDEAGFQKLNNGAFGSGSSTVIGYRQEVQSGPASIRHWLEIAKTQEPGQTGWQILADEKVKLQAAQWAVKVSGPAKLTDANGFAYRVANTFLAGYLDPTDQRLRFFKGPLKTITPASPDAAKNEYSWLRSAYRAREAAQIPEGPGFCTGHGFIREEAQSAADVRLDLQFRSLQYPNLIFAIRQDEAQVGDRTDIQKEPQMGLREAGLHVADASHVHGPKAIDILGAPARIISAEYSLSCKADDPDCDRPDTLYEVEASTYGRTGQLAHPNFTLYMAAALPDDYKARRTPPPSEGADDPTPRIYTTPTRPGLTGHQPPSYAEGMKIFERVLQSIRLRPNSIAGATTVMTMSQALTPAQAAAASTAMTGTVQGEP